MAVQRIDEGCTPDEVARVLGMTRRSVERWLAARRDGDDAALAAKPHPGAAPKLTPRQQAQVLSWLGRSPGEFGFATELWSAPRVAKVIEQRFGVRYHPRYVNAWLAARDVTPQKPERRARERDEAEIERWKRQEWPRLEKRRGR